MVATPALDWWERNPCNTGTVIVGNAAPLSAEYFRRIEAHRYAVEPMIHSWARFTTYAGKKLLEVGVGAGTDHLQWARAGLVCHGIDATPSAIRIAAANLAVHGQSSRLSVVNAERMDFPDESFDLVWCWGVIHHCDDPEGVVAEIRRVLRPGGEFAGMMYHRRSVQAVRLWLKHALLAGKPLQSLTRVIAEHVESPGTRAFTVAEMRGLLSAFSSVDIRPMVTHYESTRFPRLIAECLPARLGFYACFRAVR